METSVRIVLVMYGIAVVSVERVVNIGDSRLQSRADSAHSDALVVTALLLDRLPTRIECTLTKRRRRANLVLRFGAPIVAVRVAM